MCDCDTYEPIVCHKCWDTFSNCDCESLKLKLQLEEAKREIKALKKELKEKVNK